MSASGATWALVGFGRGGIPGLEVLFVVVGLVVLEDASGLDVVRETGGFVYRCH